MKFLTPRLEREWNDKRLSSVVKSIVLDAELIAAPYKWEFIVTSIYRTPEEDKALGGHGIHPAWRAVDVRTNNTTQKTIDTITAIMNRRWSYDPARPSMVVFYTEPHGSGAHAHVQSYGKTIRNKAVT